MESQTIRDRAIVYDDIVTPADLPQGWTDEQDPGRYRLERRDDGALFGFAVGPAELEAIPASAAADIVEGKARGQDNGGQG